MLFFRTLILSLLLAVTWPLESEAQIRPLGLVLPTDNDAIFSTNPENFYMYTNRSFEGKASTPWQAGQFGYVRNPRRTAEGLVYTRFHEGVDIKPVKRDSAGRPLDAVRAISDGKVVHVNPSAGASSYGRYVVVEHEWGYGPFFSLYAHLETISAKVGDTVRAGDQIAIMGYTGTGLNRTRAHLHLELCMRLNTRFGKWHSSRYTLPNKHGMYNGLNLVGIDIASLYAKHRKDPGLNLAGFITEMEPYFRVRVPKKGVLEIVENYPWLYRPKAGGDSGVSWEISFSSSGVPLSVVTSSEPTTTPKVVWVKHSKTYHSYLTRGRLGGSGSSASLQNSGQAYIQLITGAF